MENNKPSTYWEGGQRHVRPARRGSARCHQTVQKEAGGRTNPKKEEDEKYQWDIRHQSEQRGRDNTGSHSTHSSQRKRSTSRSAARTQQTTHDEQPWRKIDQKQAFGQSTSAPEVKDAQPEEVQGEEIEIDWDYDLTQSPYNPIDDYLGSEQETTPATKSQPMVYDPIPRYLHDLVPTKKGVPPENPATEALLEQSSSSGTCSFLESDDGEGGVAQEQADEGYLKEMQVDYKGTEGTWEDIGGVPEVYHPIPCMEEDQLLSGEVMDASPGTESTLLANSTQAAAETVPPATRDTTTAASASVNPDMPTAEEFLDMPELKTAQAERDEEWEESPVSFDVTSHQTPSLPTPKESLTPERMERWPAKKNKKSKKGGKAGRC